MVDDMWMKFIDKGGWEINIIFDLGNQRLKMVVYILSNVNIDLNRVE